jgi:hypothetical protein
MGNYVDSALFGSKHGVECIVDFCGSDRVLFGTDAPIDTDTVPTSFGSLSLTSRTPCTTKHRGQRSSRQCPQIFAIHT